MNLADRLRGVVDGPEVGARHASPPPARRPSADPRNIDHVADILGGEWREWHGHPYLVVERKYPPGHRHGRIAVADGAPEQKGCWPTLSILEPSADGRPVLFIDLETTGLAGGAGTYAFLVGCGWFECATFRVRQFLLAGYGAERGLLEDVAKTAGGAGALATYNGKTFDLPLIETRFLLHRMTTPFEGMPHIDMLHPARRLWRSATGTSDVVAADRRATCRLAAVEETVLGYVRDGDVPGFDIPSRYFQYVRTGDPRPLEAVLEHNRLDLLSLAMLTSRAAHLLDQGAAAAGTGREALGLGRLYQRAGMLAEARACFARAAGLDVGADRTVGPYTGDVTTRAEGLRAYALLCRRVRHYEEAADAWRRLLDLQTSPPQFVQEATEALAVHHEHRLRDFHVARECALRSLQFDTTVARRKAVHHRLARLDRKLAGAEQRRGARAQPDRSLDPAPLF